MYGRKTIEAGGECRRDFIALVLLSWRRSLFPSHLVLRTNQGVCLPHYRNDLRGKVSDRLLSKLLANHLTLCSRSDIVRQIRGITDVETSPTLACHPLPHTPHLCCFRFNYFTSAVRRQDSTLPCCAKSD